MSLLVLVGPTGAGKTALALELARRAPIELVSLDSVQLYRGLDIGSAKPTLAERAALRHHLVDIADPDERFSAARWLSLAEAALADIIARGRVPLVCGGTGLYLRALGSGLAELPSADDALRARLLGEEAAAPGTLHARLREVDPASAARIAPRDHVRLVRALEVHATTGRTLSAHFAEHAASRRQRPLDVLVLDPSIEEHAHAIEQRAEEMLRQGLVDEARALRERFGPVPVLDSVGYKEALATVDGKLHPSELGAAIARATRQFARRQRTWFKKAPGARQFDHPAPLLEAALRRLEI